MSACREYLYARPETGFWDEATLEKYQIAEAFCLYHVEDDGSNTVDVMANAQSNHFIHWLGTPADLQIEADEELAHEGIYNPDYLMQDELERADARFISDLDEEPEILSFDVWADWHRSKKIRQIPPIANWGMNGLTNLPLFVAAANLMRSRRHVDPCVEYQLQKRQLERVGFSWNL